MQITKLHRLVINTLSVMFCVVKTLVNSNQTRKELMKLPRQCFQQRNNLITKRTKLFISRIFLSALIEKKRLTAQSIQNLIIWCLLALQNKFSCFEPGERSLMIDLTLQYFFFFVLFLVPLLSRFGTLELRNRVTQNNVTLGVTNSKIFIEILTNSVS